ncbi:hypothetical protein DWX97_05410 [Bacteroides cellulosilyticus]|uniref:Uncharacterized protein n=1 Tax=Bacteroides cellulosilyticus TaxID=246787 RepID=A0A412IL33_9BACE|nr:hypothetical protein DWX97_05410 [Bacteroides cellulosilyticus]
MEIYSAFNIKVNNTNREAGRFPYFFCVERFIREIHSSLAYMRADAYFLNFFFRPCYTHFFLLWLYSEKTILNIEFMKKGGCNITRKLQTCQM